MDALSLAAPRPRRNRARGARDWFARSRAATPERRAFWSAVAASLVVVSGAFWFVTGGGPAGADEGVPTAVVAEASGGRLLVGVSALALGATSEKDAAVGWHKLAPESGRADTGVGRVALGSAELEASELTEARVTFRSVGLVEGDTLQELDLPRDSLRLRVPGEPGRAGDTLLLVIDVDRSVVVVDGFLVFAPHVSRAEWLRTSGVSADGNGDSEGGGENPTEWFSFDADNESSGFGTGGGNGGAGGGENGGNSNVGRAAIYVRDVAAAEVRHLNATFGKVGTGPVGGGARDATTYFHGAKTIDLRAYDAADARAHLVTFQLPAGEYGSLHLEFDAAGGVILNQASEFVVPQPHLVVEEPFTIRRGETLEFLLDFSIEESLVPGGDGWEFRPVVSQLQTSAADNDEDGEVDPRDPDDDNDGIPDSVDPDRDGDGQPDEKPSQYRAGGSPMPSIGRENKETVEGTTGDDMDETQGNVDGLLEDDDGNTHPLGSGDVDLPGGDGDVVPDLRLGS